MKTIETIKKDIEKHYKNQLSIIEITKDDETVWYRGCLKNEFFIPMNRHVLIDVDFTEKTVKMYVDLENLE